MGKRSPRGRPSPDLWDMTVEQLWQLAHALDTSPAELAKRLTPAWERFDALRASKRARRDPP